jgi:hypothetical protein
MIMANCERCGKPIPDGVVFCDDCSTGGISRRTKPTPSTPDLLHDDHELFTFKGKHSSNIVRIMKIIPILIGLFSIFLGAILLFPDLADISIPPILLPLFATFLASVYLLRLSRQSRVTSWMFLVLAVIVITMGTALAFPDYDSQIFAIGITVASVLFIYTVFRNYKGNKIPVLSMTLIIASIGIGITLPELLLVVLPITLIISGLLIILKF